MTVKKGILLSGGTGSRLFPSTKAVNKHLFPVFNKPMIYYPLANFLQANIREVLIITNEGEVDLISKLLGDGSHLGISINYAVQKKPSGLPEAFIIGEKFINNEPVALNLGDHIFFGQELNKILPEITKSSKNTTILSVQTDHPEESGVVCFNDNNEITSIVEKPKQFISNWIICGLYFYSSGVSEISKNLTPSIRGELEIIDLISHYLISKKLDVIKFNEKISWMDAGTPTRILEAGNILRDLEINQNQYYGYLEFIALNKGYIGFREYSRQIDKLKESNYGTVLSSLVA